MSAAPKWIDFVEVTAPGVTKRWEVRTKQSGDVIAIIAWSTGWRRYVLRPLPSEWEQDCLRDVADFLETRTRERNAERAHEKARG